MATEDSNITKVDSLGVGDAGGEIMATEDSIITKVDILGGGSDANDALGRSK
jgi:hypothetical protein